MKRLALAEAGGGLTLAYDTDWPTSFWITAAGATMRSEGIGCAPRRERAIAT